MKKLYTLVLMFVASLSFGQSVVITKVVDGSLSSEACGATTGGSSSPKFVELYVSGTADLSFYRVQTEANGAADEAAISWNSGTYMTYFGTVTDSFVYLVYASNATAGTPIFNEMFPNIPASRILVSTSAPNMNGNDALRVALYDTPAPLTGAATGNLVSVIDQFGNPLQISGSSDFTAPWAYEDSYASRNNGVLANAGNYDTSSFTYGGNNLFDAPNNTCAYIVDAAEVGTYNAIAGVKDNSISGLKVFPNPLSGNVLNITSDKGAEKTVAIFDVLGKQVVNTKTATETVNVSGLTAGVYIVKITEEGKTATRKLVVK